MDGPHSFLSTAPLRLFAKDVRSGRVAAYEYAHTGSRVLLFEQSTGELLVERALSPSVRARPLGIAFDPLGESLHHRGFFDVVQPGEVGFQVFISLGLDFALVRLLAVTSVDFLDDFHPLDNRSKGSKTGVIQPGIIDEVNDDLA